MASSERTLRDNPFPAPAQIALALAVLNSKPPERAIEDHLALLRGQLVQRSTLTEKPASQEPDSSQYWKKAYEKSEEQKTELLNKLLEFEKNEFVTALSSSPTAVSPFETKGKKRREYSPAAKANCRSKRRATISKSICLPVTNDDSRAQREAWESGEVFDAPKLLQAFFSLRIQLRDQLSDLAALHSSARSLCTTLLKTVQASCSKPKLDKRHSNELVKIWLAIHRIYGTLLEALDALCAPSLHRGGAKSLIPELAQIQTELLKCLQSLAKQEQPLRAGLRSGSQSHYASHQINELSNLIASFITALDLSKPAQRELFDGMLCTFFDFLGSNLSTAVFSEPGNEKLQQAPKPKPPRGLLADGHDKMEIDLPNTLKLAPYLIKILRKTKSQIDKRGNFGSSSRAVHRVQNTLLQAMFGEQDPAFRDSLERSAEVRSIEFAQDAAAEDAIVDKEEDVTPTWFIGEVWNNVGWDILTKHIREDLVLTG